MLSFSKHQISSLKYADTIVPKLVGFKCTHLEFNGSLLDSRLVLPKGNLIKNTISSKDWKGSELIQPEPVALGSQKYSLMILEVPSLLPDCWFGPFERESRRLPKGKKHLPDLEVPPIVGWLTCGRVFHLQCFLKVRKAFAALEAAFKLGHLTRVAADFNCCQVPKDLKDQVTPSLEVFVCLKLCQSCNVFANCYLD